MLEPTIVIGSIIGGFIILGGAYIALKKYYKANSFEELAIKMF